MALWTLFGLAARKGDDRLADGGRDGRPGRRARHAALRCRELAATAARNAPTSVRPRRSQAHRCRRGGSPSTTAAASSASSASRPVRPERCATSSDWAFGVRDARRSRLVESDRRPHLRRRGTTRQRRVSPQPAYPPRRRRLLQRLRIRTAGAEQSVLQPASARHLLHRLAALRRPAAGHRAGDPRHARAAARHLRGDGGAALGAWRSAPAPSRAASPAAATPAATASTACFRSMSICPAVRPIPPRSSQALLMFLDRAPQRVKGGRLVE